jgi:CRP/FNR family transcriptional regulator
VHQEGPGGLLGEVALFGTGAYPATAETTEPSVLAFLDAQAVHRALATDPALAPLLLRRLALRTGEVIARLDRIAHLTVPARVAAHLLGRVEARPSRAAPDEAVSLGMTLVRLADELGTVKALVVRALAALRRARVIEAVGAGRYRVLDLPALRRIAGGGVR